MNFIKSKKGIVLSTVIFLLIAIGSIFIYTSNKNNNVGSDGELKYQILDQSVLEGTEMGKWVEEKSKEKGSYINNDDKYSYILISNGNTKKSNIGICLEQINFKKNITVEYSITTSSDLKDAKEYIPRMIIRMDKTDKQIKINEVKY